MSRALGVLRPEPGNSATVARIAALGRRALRLPLFVVRAVAWQPPDPACYDSLVLTSANALRHGGAGLARLTSLPVHAVGDATAAAARHRGFTVVAVGDRGVTALRPPGRVLHLVGRDHGTLSGADSIVVYASEALRPDLGLLIGGVALVHSARAAHVLAEMLADRGEVALAAISAAAAHAAGEGWRGVAIADRPTDAALVAVAIALAD